MTEPTSGRTPSPEPFDEALAQEFAEYADEAAEWAEATMPAALKAWDAEGRVQARSTDDLRQHIRLDHGVNAKMYPGEQERQHEELHRLEAIRRPLLCRLGWHRFDGWSSMDYGHHIERVCRRGWTPGVLPCGVRERKAWGGKRWVRQVKTRCTHAVDGGPIPSCMSCANERRHPW